MVETVDYYDLIMRNGVYYKKSTYDSFNLKPYTGKVTGYEEGSIRNGKKEGESVSYWENGKLREKGTYKNGKLIK